MARPAGSTCWTAPAFGPTTCVQQLALPTRPLDVAHGMDSRVVHLLDGVGRQVAAGWLRTLASTGDFVHSGCYSARLLPGSVQPSIHVAFPLESGNVQVILRPSVRSDGSLVLSSLLGRLEPA